MDQQSIEKLRRDIRESAKLMTRDEARFAVDTYYDVQEWRIRINNQVKALERAGSNEPHQFLEYTLDQAAIFERQIGNGLKAFAQQLPEWEWMESVLGIGPVITAGLAANIDIRKAPTVGHIWSFAGIESTSKWEKGKKRPWNASLKTLCWKIGESFVKVSGREDAFYGKVYVDRKVYEQRKNEAGDYADQARRKLENFNIGQDTEAHKHYSEGRLPPGHIHARSKRYAVKLFLAHYHEVLYRTQLWLEPPKPYSIAHLGHVHKIPVPGFRAA